jgi:hypothetical protein
MMLLLSGGKKEFSDSNSNGEPLPPGLGSIQDVEEFEEFYLKVGEPIPTVLVGPGTSHELIGNKPFVAIATRPDNGKWVKYQMPAGRRCYWNGADPAGHLLLEGVDTLTVVRVRRLK